MSKTFEKLAPDARLPESQLPDDVTVWGMAELLVHLIVSPTLTVIGFGSYPKLTTEPGTVFDAGAVVVVVGSVVVVVVGLVVVVGGRVVGVLSALVESLAPALDVVVDRLVVLVVRGGIGGLVGRLVNEGSTVSTVV